METVKACQEFVLVWITSWQIGECVVKFESKVNIVTTVQLCTVWHVCYVNIVQLVRNHL